jgi:hypothetical protein
VDDLDQSASLVGNATPRRSTSSLYAVKRISLMLASLLVTACSGGQYANADAFHHDVSAWKIEGISVARAAANLQGRGFTCVAVSCSKNISGYPCAQRLRIDLVVDGGLVKDFTIWTVNGALPEVCL